MCQRNPLSAKWLTRVAGLTLFVGAAFGQNFQPEMGWKRVGGTAIDRGLAGLAGGPLAAVWYNPSGSALYVRTASGRILETSDFEQWRVSAISATPTQREDVQSAGNRYYARTDENILASGDGRTWLNVTAFNGRSIIGGGFTSLAVSPADASDIAAANQFGVWRSLDGGLSWRSLNEGLPNLPVRRLLGRRLALLDDNSKASLEGGAWQISSADDAEAALFALAGRSVARVSAVAQAGGVLYAGSADGRLLTSRDEGVSWAAAPQSTGAPVGRIWADPERAETALAVTGSRLFRTVNGGLFWDDVTGSLVEAPLYAVVGDSSADVVYVATGRGVMTANLQLMAAGPAASNWRQVNRSLPTAAVWDIRLNADNTLTVALDGFGVYETRAPHRSRAVHLVNAADLSNRPAAPGSLLTVLNAAVGQAQAQTSVYPVIASSPESSQLQVPFEARAGAYQLALTGANGRWTLPVDIRETSPSLFVDSDGAPLLLDTSTGLVLDPNVAVRAGSTVAILATGMGKVTPEWPAGKPAPLEAPPVVTTPVAAYLDGIPVEVTRATLAPGYVGYYLVEIRIPRIVNRGVANLRLAMNGEGSNPVRLLIEP